MPLDGKIARAGAFAAAFAALTACFISKIYDFDLWFHLTIGREIVRTRALPTSEFYVHTVLGRPAEFHEWGFHVLAYLVHQGLGWWGLALLNAGLGAAAIALLTAAARRRGASMTAALVLAAPLAILIAPRVQYRPEIVLFAALGATVYALERAEHDRRWLLALPVLTVTLSLFHLSPLLLLLVAGSRAVDFVVAAREDRKRVTLLAAGAIAAGAGVVGLVPYGFDQLVKPFLITGSEAGIASRVMEYMPTLRTARAPEIVALAVLACAALVVARRRPSDVLLALGFGVIGFRHVRGLPLFALVVFPVIALAAERGFALLRSRVVRVLAPVAALGAAVVYFASSALWGAGPLAGRFPERTAEFIGRHRPSGQMLNQLHTGAFLAWRLYPSYLVAIDGHFWGENDAFRFAEPAFAAATGWREALRSRDITMIATPATGSYGSMIPLVAELDRDPEWKLVVSERAGLLFLRSDIAAALAVPELPRTAIWELVLTETAQALEWYGAAAPRAYLSRGIALFQLHDFDGAAPEFARYVTLVPSDREAAQIAQLLRATLSGDKRAAAELERIYGAREGARR
jgi:hypothetical protein